MKKFTLFFGTVAALSFLAAPITMAGTRQPRSISSSGSGASFSARPSSFSAAKSGFSAPRSGFTAPRGSYNSQRPSQFARQGAAAKNWNQHGSVNSQRRTQFAQQRVAGARNWNGAGRHCGRHGQRGHRGRHSCRYHNVYFASYGYPFYGYGWGDPWYGYPYYAADYYPYDDGVVYEGLDVSLVLQVQRRLARAGYYQGTIDGVIGARTRSAIRAYERSNQLPVDGAIDDRLLARMGLS